MRKRRNVGLGMQTLQLGLGSGVNGVVLPPVGIVTSQSSVPSLATVLNPTRGGFCY